MSYPAGVSLGPAKGVPRTSHWVALGALAGVIVGGAAAVSITLALLLAIAIAGVTVITLQPAAIIALLGAAAFVENIQVGTLTISRFVAAMGLFVVLAEVARRRLVLIPQPPLYWVSAYSIWAIASMLWSVSGHRTYIGLSSLMISASFMLALATLITTRRELDVALYGIAISASIVGLIAIILFVTGGGARAAGFAGDPNFFAQYQVFAFPILLMLSAQAKRRWVQLLLFGGVVTSIGATFTTLSRGGILALTLVGALLLILPARSFFRSLSQKTIATLVVAVGVGLALMVSYTELSHRINSLVTGQEAAGSGRVNEWRGAWSSTGKRPVLGLGFGAFPAVSNELVRNTPGTDLYHFDERPTGVFVHNAYLGSLAEMGIPGLILYLGVFGSTMLSLRRSAARAKRVGDLSLARVANALFLSLVGWALTSFFLSSETARPYWVTIGIALALPKLLPALQPRAPQTRYRQPHAGR